MTPEAAKLLALDAAGDHKGYVAYRHELRMKLGWKGYLPISREVIENRPAVTTTTPGPDVAASPAPQYPGAYHRKKKVVE